uniref:RWD domain-containing protein n=1 Tax=Asterionellopsis glacialis TaxID=33640 RepID=A0A7S0KXS7_9STRA
MSDHCEEQQMEAEALTAIFDTAFTIVKEEQPFEWIVKLVPIDTGDDDDEKDDPENQNHVMINLKITLPSQYPELDLPVLDIEILKGLSLENKEELLQMAQDEAQNNEGMPSIYSICEVLREWLCDNNVKGLDDASMHAQMMRKQKEKERSKQRAAQEFESQKKEEDVSQAELEEMEVRKRRAEGTPCTADNFRAWKLQFDAEMMERQQQQKLQEEQTITKKQEKLLAKKQVDKSGRLTGYAQFSDKVMGLSIEEMEQAAEHAQVDEDEYDDEEDVDNLEDLDEDLFDVDDDLDDLDSSDEDDLEDDEEEEEIDI